MSKAKRTATKRTTTTKPKGKRSAEAMPAKQLSIAGAEPVDAGKVSFVVYLTHEQRELVAQLARHLSAPYEKCSLNAAVRKAFLRGATALLAEPGGA